MFGGHNNDDKSEENKDAPHDEGHAPVINSNAVVPDATTEDVLADDAPAVSDDPNWQHPGTPLEPESTKINDVISPAGGFPRSTSNQVHDAGSPGSVPTDDADDLGDPSLNDLIDVRQKALGELSPLLEQLDLSPEEKFRTVMMVIQASDDQALVKEAYEAAHGIKDDKARAQALLDIVNEINYFTQPPES
jgi:hypothetical protein